MCGSFKWSILEYLTPFQQENIQHPGEKDVFEKKNDNSLAKIESSLL